MTKREARIIALEHCAALIEQQVLSSFGFIELVEDETDDDFDKVAGEAARIRDRLRERAGALRRTAP